MENFNLVSPYQENRFMLALGHHPFQSNNEMKAESHFHRCVSTESVDTTREYDH